MQDTFNREIDYLRISVTDRCNLRCRYCMPEGGVDTLSHKQILSYEEIIHICSVAIGMGFKKFRITGGEPLVRKDICKLIGGINALSGVEDLSITTNAILLSDFAAPLFESGIKRINISLDTLNPDRFQYITRGGNLEKVLCGIKKAKEIGFNPIKINCVIKDSVLEDDAISVKQYCEQNGLELRYIREMNLANGTFSQIIGGTRGKCNQCNRLRLTADGKLKPCLFNDMAIDIRTYGVEQSIQMAIKNKPEKGLQNYNNKFYNIGG